MEEDGGEDMVAMETPFSFIPHLPGERLTKDITDTFYRYRTCSRACETLFILLTNKIERLYSKKEIEEAINKYWETH